MIGTLMILLILNLCLVYSTWFYRGKLIIDHPDHNHCEANDLAYFERNMLALKFADGWYEDTKNNWEGWKRVLSLDNGKCNFHIPDDFPVGDLPKIEPNWDGHTTEEKWDRVLRGRNIDVKLGELRGKMSSKRRKATI